MPTPSRLLIAVALCFSGGAAFAADNCEPIRQGIEANIASKGLTGFSVIVVDVSAQAPGEEVGRCGNGTRKIMYVREGGASTAVKPLAPAAPAPAKAAVKPAAAPAANPAAAGHSEPILTECKDGTVSMGGNCKP
jgi:hypothetical protein